VIYRLLGELEIGEGSRLLHLPGGPTLVVLAALLVNANRRMSKTEADPRGVGRRRRGGGAALQAGEGGP
jgi:hypothetical protein